MDVWWSLFLVCLLPLGYTIFLLAIGYWMGSRGVRLRSPFAVGEEGHDV